MCRGSIVGLEGLLSLVSYYGNMPASLKPSPAQPSPDWLGSFVYMLALPLRKLPTHTHGEGSLLIELIPILNVGGDEWKHVSVSDYLSLMRI